MDELQELRSWIERQIDNLWVAPLCYCSVDDRIEAYKIILDKIDEMIEERKTEPCVCLEEVKTNE